MSVTDSLYSALRSFRLLQPDCLHTFRQLSLICFMLAILFDVLAKPLVLCNPRFCLLQETPLGLQVVVICAVCVPAEELVTVARKLELGTAKPE